METKVCKACGTQKPIDEFYLLKGGPTREAQCKKCRTARQIATRKKNIAKNVNVNLTGEKTCSLCQLPKPKTEFSLSRQAAGGLASRCKECYKKTYYCSLDSQITHRLRLARERSEERKFPFDIDASYVKSIWESQGGVCAITGVTITPEATGTADQHGPYSLSIDRLDNSKGYVRGNIRLTCHAANMMRNVWSDQEVLDNLLPYLKHQGFIVEKGSQS